MHAEDRIIHLSTELIHRPIEHQVTKLQKLYFDLSQTRAAYDSTEFSRPPQYRFYSRRGKKTQSVAVFLPDRMVLIEEWTDMALSDFQAKVREVGLRAMNGLGIPQFVAQTVTLRSTFVLSHFDDARVFLLDHACGQRDRIGAYFQRPVAVGGLRFVLPETPEHKGALHVIIESFRHSLNEVFVEVKGVFAGQRVDAENLEPAVDGIQRVRTFITDNVFPYLDQFDQPQEEAP